MVSRHTGRFLQTDSGFTDLRDSYATLKRLPLSQGNAIVTGLEAGSEELP